MEQIYLTFLIITCIVAFLLFIYYLLGYFLYRSVFKRCDTYFPNSDETDPNSTTHVSFDAISIIKEKKFLEKENKKVKILSFDKKELVGHYFPYSTPSHKYLISLHGYRGSWQENSFVANVIFDKGFNVLMIDQRGHHESSGKYFSMGYKESRDLFFWITYIVNKDPLAQIVLYGLSMGAATLMFSMKYPMPKNVKCAIEDCGYSCIKEELFSCLNLKFKTKLISKKFILSSLESFCYLKGININISTKESLLKCQTPILFIHGSKDMYVPFAMLDTNFSNLKSGVFKQKEVFDATHASSAYSDPDRYKTIISNFTDNFIK